jgi:transglutaminase-like putative cysteine protease
MSMALVLGGVLAALALPPSGPAPSWVEPVELPTSGGVDGASRLLLHDVQVRLGKQEERFEHLAWKVLSQTGVEALSRQEFEWDPAWEKLELHGVWIWRDGTRRVAWHPEDARVIQRESSLAEGMYDGRLTLIIELRDLREGDVVEIASSTRGQNPVFKGHFASRQYQSWGEGLERSRFRLVWERPGALQFVLHGDAKAPSITTEQGAQVYRWDLTKQPAVQLEPSMPLDLEPAPYVEFSDWKDWAEVIAWAEGLFLLPAAGARFAKELERFKGMSEGDRTAAIVRFVQDDVRYVGVEIGEHSHQPHTPAWVLERGFGDCKDKSLLLVSFLRAAGLQAWPALVHSSMGAVLPKVAPSPNAFNHAIVQVVFPSGPRFIDPTMTLRRGAVEKMSQPRYHHALVVKPGATALEEIPADVVEQPTWEVEQHWEVPSRTGKATLSVTTTARGREASTLRRQVKSKTQEVLSRDYRRAREEDLEKKLTPLEVTWTDDEGAELFVLREKYETPEFFVDGTHRFLTVVINNDLKKLNEQERKWPFAIWYPLRVKEIVRYDAPAELQSSDFELVNKVISHAAFKLAVAQQISGRTLKLEWELETTADRVLPADVASYRRLSGEAWEQLGYRVEPPPEARAVSKTKPLEIDEPSPWAAWGLVLMMAMLMLGMMAVARSSSPEAAAKRSARALQFRARQSGLPGELASNPAQVRSLEAGVKLFTSVGCPQGHAWGVVDQSDRVRLGDDHVTVLSRRCGGCDAREDRYVKLLGN